MTTWRRYNFEYPGPWQRGRYDIMRHTMRIIQESAWWYEDGVIEGEPYGRMSLSFTVAARDQWWSHRRAMVMAEAVFHAAGVAMKAVPVPTWEKLAPHTNRGHAVKHGP